MKGIIIAMLLSVLPCGVCFADGAHFLVVNSKDGTKTTFALADKPKVSFVDGELSIVSNSKKFAMNIADVKNYTFEEESTGIGKVIKNGNAKFENGYVVFSGLTVGSKVSAYTQEGRLIKECTANENGTAFIDLSILPKRIIILHSGKTGIKVVNR
jgi:hypothetical protein